MEQFKIFTNKYLNRPVRGYYHQHYTGFHCADNPEFINTLKDNFAYTKDWALELAREEAEKILLADIPAIIADINTQYNLPEWVLVCVPRSRAEDKLFPSQKLFRKAVSDAAQKIPSVKDGTNVFIRHTTVRTTHIKKSGIEFHCADGTVVKNDEGKFPFPGIAKETCHIDRSLIEGKNIILIDDVYTKQANIDEDCIQALFDNGARNVVFYAVGYTQRG